jgi:putative endonuclease
MRSETGKAGENCVACWLEEKGYEILERNFHSRYGEIDIIAKRGTYIAFVEVKTRAPNSLVSPLEAITPAKQRKLTATAMEYLRQNPCKLQPRFDAAAVCSRGDVLTVEVYLENAFFAQ